MPGEIQLKQLEGFVGNPLERLYTLEKVDPKTIRTYVPQGLSKEKKGPSPLLEPYREIGGGYPLLGLFDLLERLKLPPTLQYQLKKEGFKTVAEALYAEEKHHPKITALPHAHQEMLRSALKPWKELICWGKGTKLDFKGYFRGLGASIDHLSFLALFHEIGLIHYVEATPYERIQVERLPSKEREDLWKKALDGIVLEKEVEEIFQGLLFGWIEERGGLTNKKELIERLEQESLDPGAAHGFLILLEKKNRKPWYEVDGTLVFDKVLRKQLNEIRGLLREFFYRPYMSYNLQQLEELFQKELLKVGEWLDPLILKRFLLLSNAYRLEKRDLVHYTVHGPLS